jgi:hypothetical protein
MLVSGEALEALPLLEESLAGHQRVLGPDHAWTRDTAHATADVFEALGRAAEAAKIRARFGGGEGAPMAAPDQEATSPQSS